MSNTSKSFPFYVPTTGPDGKFSLTYARTHNGPSAEGAKLVLLVNFLGFCKSRRHAGGGRLVPTAGDCPDA